MGWYQQWCCPGFHQPKIFGTMTVFANSELSPRLLPNPVQVWPAFFQLYQMGERHTN